MSIRILVLFVLCFGKPLFADNRLLLCKQAGQYRVPDSTDQAAIGKKGVGVTFSSDSGFVTKQEGVRFLLSVIPADTSRSFWKHVTDSDTIGRYYQQHGSGHYVLCLADYSGVYDFETHLLFEVKADGTVLKAERYYHGNYPCCWNNAYEGFYKMGDFFVMTVCGTGSGYCGSEVYVFRELISQSKQNSIRTHYWFSDPEGGDPRSLYATMECKGGAIIVHYTFETGSFSEDNTRFQVAQTERFDVSYQFRKGKWKPSNTRNQDKLQLF